MFRLPVLALLAACCLVLAPGASFAQGGPQGGTLQVVATFSVLGDLTRTVGGDRIALRTLVGPDGDVHTFEPSPTDGAALAGAALVVENGYGLEPWLDKLYVASGSQAARVSVNDGLEPLTPLEEGGGEHEHEDEEEADPHAWHDVTRAAHQVEMIRDALAEADPASTQVYQANAASYLAQLRQLDGWVAEQVNTVPPERRKLVTTHDTFQYFAKRYGLTVVGTAIRSFSTEAGDPSAGELAELVDQIKEAGVPVIFAENVSNPALMERVAEAAGVQLGPRLYTDALGAPGSPGATYVGMMRYNVTSIVTALRQ
jgi:zinc/manganese transport system substrate-binding protein